MLKVTFTNWSLVSFIVALQLISLYTLSVTTTFVLAGSISAVLITLLYLIIGGNLESYKKKYKRYRVS